MLSQRVKGPNFAKIIWKLASPSWHFDAATFDRSAASLDHPDHIAIVVHNYRWRLGLAAGESRYDDLERRLAEGPVPTITLEGDANGRRSPRRPWMSTAISRAGGSRPRPPLPEGGPTEKQNVSSASDRRED